MTKKFAAQIFSQASQFYQNNEPKSFLIEFFPIQFCNISPEQLHLP